MGINKDQVKDRAHEVKGKIKEDAADLAGNGKSKLNGKSKPTLGKEKAKLDNIRQELKDDFFLDFRE